jgi:hypothetical protein
MQRKVLSRRWTETLVAGRLGVLISDVVHIVGAGRPGLISAEKARVTGLCIMAV